MGAVAVELGRRFTNRARTAPEPCLRCRCRDVAPESFGASQGRSVRAGVVAVLRVKLLGMVELESVHNHERPQEERCSRHARAARHVHADCPTTPTWAKVHQSRQNGARDAGGRREWVGSPETIQCSQGRLRGAGERPSTLQGMTRAYGSFWPRVQRAGAAANGWRRLEGREQQRRRQQQRRERRQRQRLQLQGLQLQGGTSSYTTRSVAVEKGTGKS